MVTLFEVGPIRPPSEAQSLLIRVTRNCPWNQCEFCHTYRGDQFSFRSVEEIKQDIDQVKVIRDQMVEVSWRMGFAGELNPHILQKIFREINPGEHGFQMVAGWLYFGANQVFLQDANSLIAPTKDLLDILRYLKDTFPSIQRITTYGRARTLSKKPLKDLQELHEAGLTRIHIGMESGFDPLLQYMKKGVTAKEHIAAGQMVVESGISLCEYVMPGLGGERWTREHAVETAKVLNQINPDFIRLRTLYVRNDMPLHKKVETGDFIPLSDDQVVSEIRLFIETLNGIQSTLVSDHILNLLEEVQGKFPQDKEKMLGLIDQYLSLPEQDRFHFRLGRRLGYIRSPGEISDPVFLRRLDHILKQFSNADPKKGKAKEIEKEIYGLMESYI
jgi:hypothetical protein